ncbi:asparagine synthase (glutamine-hydrolyzing) [Salipaludibacillus sp. LMS25]|jgi:asparagine synthase (glutamine-hydrolysing)|uniref:asparagine synthase (glutamine-hydrolyzing) n=1 Tax=Salipaludibacillus sp. LMS25 TaxID=2924031 RepID=UPI0020D075E7|nr:asparagine synthase (glutamine-hydrolyzing) [Salipaludibacillus sp. LMS25]UTR14540.1 asparagine synthase (glutamine-hydrolyzing) [Salipaludibacillus sp. LMS25]
MCGITGWVDQSKNLINHEDTLKRMANKLSLRGPDAITTWSCEKAVFGHTRLIVVDPAGGAQPMTKKKNGFSYTICYNGELYNTEDIRKELSTLGYSFNSHSDTEVLLTAYIQWREACVERLTGIFAFAVWDEERHELFLARDRLGVKPLFYTLTNKGIIFGSEIKAILAHPAINTNVNIEGWQELLGLSPSRTPGHGIFSGMKELRPAHHMRFKDGKPTVQRYWQVKSLYHRESIAETVAHIRHLVTAAVEGQLVADVPVSTFLSGGLDSSAISAIAAAFYKEKGRSPLKTFSFDYEENERYFTSSHFQPDADSPWVERMVEELNTDHTKAVIKQSELYKLLESAVEARDLPGMADIDSSLLWFCGEIRKQATVALSGECADEIFGGYPWFRDKEKLQGEIFPWMNSLEERERLLRPEWQNKLHLKNYVTERYKETLREVPVLEGESEEEAQRRSLFYVNMTWFMTTLLERKDRMSMAQSLEVRVPFADHNLVEYVWNIPWEMKMLHGREKGILRRAMEGILPHDVLYRKKSPFPKTHHPTYRKLVSDSLMKLVEQKESPLFDKLDYQKVKTLAETEGSSFKKPYFGQLMTGPQLMAYLLQLDRWMRHYNVS